MFKKHLLLLAASCFLAGALLSTGNGGASDAGPAAMELKSATGKKAARFPHRQHQERFACKACHHGKTDSGARSPYVEGMEIRKCGACHNSDAMSNPKLNSFKLAAHGLCKECHKKNRESAPTKCSGCHIK